MVFRAMGNQLGKAPSTINKTTKVDHCGHQLLLKMGRGKGFGLDDGVSGDKILKVTGHIKV